MFQPQQAAELGSFSHMGERGYGISIYSWGKLLRPSLCQGCPCVEAQRGHCVKLCRWSLDWLGDPKLLDVLDLWETCWGKLLTGYSIQPKRKKCVAINKAEKNWRSEACFDTRHGDTGSRVSSVVFRFFFSSISHYALLERSYIAHATVYWKYMICFFISILQKITVKRLYTAQRRLWTLKLRLL